ncbi:MAG: hypothetical protein JST40_03550 [Armatimonadetes bacterium]|nr:hypothetical protein [Armatimonadota bacterium]
MKIRIVWIAALAVLVFAGCSAPSSTGSTDGTTVAKNGAGDPKGVDGKPSAPMATEEGKSSDPKPGATEPSKPEDSKPADPAAATSEKPEKQSPDAKEADKVPTNPYKEKDPKLAEPKKLGDPAKKVAPSGDPGKYVGVYHMDNEKVNKELAAKKKPPIIFTLEIKKDGTYSLGVGKNSLQGTVVVKEDRIELHPYSSNGQPVRAAGQKAVFNMQLTPDGKRLETIANVSGNQKVKMSFLRQ